MERRPLGRTGLQVSVLGFGAGHVGGPELTETEAAALLHGVLDAGINLIDTAPGYGASEERIGRHLHGRRSEFVLSTKCGYGVAGVEDWTPECITRGVDQALMRLRTDVLDVVHFHSCPLEVLQRPGLVEALVRAVEAGKVRAAAYSGDNAAMEYAVETGAFTVVQTSVNLFDQRAIERGVAWARAKDLGVIAKRPLGNAPWRFAERPSAHDLGEYWHRMRTLALDSRGLDWSDVALRFAAHVPGVSTCIVGTGRLEHLRRNIRALEAGPLPTDFAEAIRGAFRQRGAGWEGMI